VFCIHSVLVDSQSVTTRLFILRWRRCPPKADGGGGCYSHSMNKILNTKSTKNTKFLFLVKTSKAVISHLGGVRGGWHSPKLKTARQGRTGTEVVAIFSRVAGR
jgi:hypothetical protein